MDPSNRKLAGLAASVGLAAAGVKPRRRGTDAGAAGSGAGGQAADPHGNHAQAPQELPARGWWEVAKRTALQVSEDRVLTEAAGITFYGLLALFPALTALVSLYGLVADPNTITQELQQASGILPAGGMQIIEERTRNLASQQTGALGFGAVAGILAALWSANAGTKALFDALNIVYEEKEKRSFLWRTVVTMSFTLAGILFLMLALASVVVLPVVLNFIGGGGVLEWALRLGRWPLLLVIVTLALSCIYRYGPSRERAKWRWVSWGGAFAAVSWVIFSIAFSWYAANFGSYDETYGSLGAAIGFMTWLWLSATVVLVGAELDAELERQTAADTTTGPERPIGQRGATMADTVADGPK
ncbi:YihY/virulence factor BrkB family protein [Teichococcus oryzae]|uniref:YihY/virulence factor BrkB family protein n=1 Tax=Teichococcus oryzae TaxID=1608942 RepID=A0A5B2TG49_9PROT|nr:YihY/virulence factor BrkB family protein [Pseudoroseomonas oryzae]KAA2213427.1 YihY/virulence factor BrkB family protein [Pseudoroseomonas oryzae]